MIKQIHYYSGLVLALFVGFHLLNHFLVLRSEALHKSFMRAARKIYRRPLVECVLLAVVLLQMCSGLILVTLKVQTASGWFDWLQLGSGSYLALFLANHVLAVMRGRYAMRIDTDLYYGAGVMNMWPQKLLYIPYYALAILSFFAHVAAVHRTKMRSVVSQSIAEGQAVGILVLGILVTFLIIYRMSHLKMPSEPFKRNV